MSGVNNDGGLGNGGNLRGQVLGALAIRARGDGLDVGRVDNVSVSGVNDDGRVSLGRDQGNESSNGEGRELHCV